MYLHLGQNTVIRMHDIVGIFDLDTTTISKHTKAYLKTAQEKKEVITITNELPKSFVVAMGKNEKREKIFVSQIATSTIKKRSEKPINDLQNFDDI